MSKTRPYDRDSLERALVHHGVKYTRPDGADRKRWFIDVDHGRDMYDTEVYAFLAGFKLAKDRAAPLASLIREFQVHDARGYGTWTSGMHRRADVAVGPYGYLELDRAAVRSASTPSEARCRNHAVAENECGR